ncbi:MAG: nucleotidyltransferase family protein [Eubacterium sp.]|nr:nucleotidyltransferase family protein [Eubacterium sp.]
MARIDLKKKQEQRCLTELLCHSLNQIPMDEATYEKLLTDTAQDEVFACAQAHAVAPLLCACWCASQLCEPQIRSKLENVTVQMAEHSYRLLFYTKYLVSILEEAGFFVAVLKGVATAEYYPQPELRKAADIDLLLFSPENCRRAADFLKTKGFLEETEVVHQHHIVLHAAEGIEVELHSMFAEPFENETVNEVMLRLQERARANVQRCACMGVPLPVLTGAYHGLSLLLHLLQHFLTSGFGIKLLCDWVVFWNRQTIETAEEMAALIQELGVDQFVAVVTALCVQKLGMNPVIAQPFLARAKEDVMEPAYLEQFFADIIEAEEFGKSEKGRMVALTEKGLWGYVKTFHHQMHLNFPRAGKCVLAWPWLWICTLVRFLHNNRTLRHTSAREIFKSAAARGKIAEKLHLFER